MTLSVKDLGITVLRNDLRELGTKRIASGFLKPESEKTHDLAGVSIALLATWMEFGTKNADGSVHVPARPGLRTGVEQNKKAIQKQLRRSVSDLIDDRVKSPTEALEAVAEVVKTGLRKTWSSAREWAEPLAISTARAKGHDQPLVESFELFENLDAKIRDKSAMGTIES